MAKGGEVNLSLSRRCGKYEKMKTKPADKEARGEVQNIESRK